ncbi:MAG: NADH-quinone oxidoreductase subunit M [Gammaproteobacteria bacterium]|nr:NADH-quinone oxidoreductase subunit M [Gammaproteobacteria bacterium]
MINNIPILTFLVWIPIISGLIIFFLDKYKDRQLFYISIFISSLILILSLLLLYKFNFSSHTLQFIEKTIWIKNFGINYFLAVDGISILFILLTTITTFLIVIFITTEKYLQINKLLSLFLILEGLLIGVFCSFDSILFYIFFEAILIPLFLIIGIWGGNNRIYATIKFFLYTLFGSVLMLVSLIYLSIQADSFSILDMYSLNLSLSTQIFLFISFLIAFGIKTPMWPVHTWLPDAHVEAPTTGSVILAGVLLKVGGYGMIRFLLPITTDAGIYLNDYLIPLSLIAIIYISFVAIAQQDMKKLIAYSSVAHMGFVTLGIFLIFNFLEKNTYNQDAALLGLQGAIMQMLSHGLISAALFLCIGIIYSRTQSKLIDNQSGIIQSMPIFSAFMIFFLLANSGLPGTSGFVGEFMVILASIKANFLYAFLASLTLVLAASYSLWLGKRVIFGNPKNTLALSEINTTEFMVLLILVIMVLFIGLKPEIIMIIMNETTTHIINSLQKG